MISLLQKSVCAVVIFGGLISASDATIYERPDGQGGVIYSDTKHKDSKPVELKQVQVFTPVEPASQTDTDHITQTDTDAAKLTPAPVPVYSTFDVASPTQEQTFWNAPTISVRFNVSPALAQSDSIQVYLDSNMVGTIKGTSTSFENLDRGEHTVYGEIVRDGVAIKSTESVTFYVHKTAVTPAPK